MRLKHDYEQNNFVFSIHLLTQDLSSLKKNIQKLLKTSKN